MDIVVRPIDPSSVPDLLGVEDLAHAYELDAFGATAPRTVEQTRAGLESSPYGQRRTWVAEVETLEGGSSLAAVGSVVLPLQDNLETIEVQVTVHPALRGHGIATAVIEQALLPAVRESGRPLVTSYGDVPSGRDVEDPDLPVRRLAARYGLTRRNVTVCRVLDLPLPEGLLAELASRARRPSADYRLLTWQDEVPAEHLVGYGALLRQLDLDDPDEDVEDEPADYTPERIRTIERRRREQGMSWLATAAQAPDGTLAGVTAIVFGTSEGTDLGIQSDTIVLPEHRGHRLGLAVKVRNHQALARRRTGLRILATWNSHVNPWMIGINESLGYRVAHHELTLQGRPELG